jgi:hypothetical protein
MQSLHAAPRLLAANSLDQTGAQIGRSATESAERLKHGERADRLRARTPSSGWSRHVTKRDHLRAALHRASRRLILIDRSRHHEHRRVIVNIAGQFRLGPVRGPISIWRGVRCS